MQRLIFLRAGRGGCGWSRACIGILMSEKHSGPRTVVFLTFKIFNWSQSQSSYFFSWCETCELWKLNDVHRHQYGNHFLWKSWMIALCHTGKNKKVGGVNTVFPKFLPPCFWILCVPLYSYCVKYIIYMLSSCMKSNLGTRVHLSLC